MSYLPESPSVTFSGKKEVRPLITLFTRWQGVAAPNGTFLDPLTGVYAGYAVTTGKTFRVVGLKVMASVPNSFTIGYADNDVGFNSATAFTNPVYHSGISAGLISWSQSTTEFSDVPVTFDIPAGKYPFATADGTTSAAVCYMYGYEY